MFFKGPVPIPAVRGERAVGSQQMYSGAHRATTNSHCSRAYIVLGSNTVLLTCLACALYLSTIYINLHILSTT